MLNRTFLAQNGQQDPKLGIKKHQAVGDLTTPFSAINKKNWTVFTTVILIQSKPSILS